MNRVGLAEAAIFLEFQLVRGIFFILLGRVISSFTLPTSKYHFIPHNYLST